MSGLGTGKVLGLQSGLESGAVGAALQGVNSLAEWIGDREGFAGGAVWKAAPWAPHSKELSCVG
jgi:hypothetical protein